MKLIGRWNLSGHVVGPFSESVFTPPITIWIIRRGMFRHYRNGRIANRMAREQQWRFNILLNMLPRYMPMATLASARNMMSSNLTLATTPSKIPSLLKIKQKIDTSIFSPVSKSLNTVSQESSRVFLDNFFFAQKKGNETEFIN